MNISAYFTYERCLSIVTDCLHRGVERARYQIFTPPCRVASEGEMPSASIEMEYREVYLRRVGRHNTLRGHQPYNYRLESVDPETQWALDRNWNSHTREALSVAPPERFQGLTVDSVSIDEFHMDPETLASIAEIIQDEERVSRPIRASISTRRSRCPQCDSVNVDEHRGEQRSYILRCRGCGYHWTREMERARQQHIYPSRNDRRSWTDGTAQQPLVMANAVDRASNWIVTKPNPSKPPKPDPRVVSSILRDLMSAWEALWTTDEDSVILNPCKVCKVSWKDCGCEDGGWPVPNELRILGGIRWKDGKGVEHALMDEELTAIPKVDLGVLAYHTTEIHNGHNHRPPAWLGDKSRASRLGNVRHRSLFSGGYKSHEEAYQHFLEWEEKSWTPNLKKALLAGLKLKRLPPWKPTDDNGGQNKCCTGLMILMDSIHSTPVTQKKRNRKPTDKATTS